MARIEDELMADDAKDSLIVFIDDPISSLDNNHIFFTFSLIDSVIVKEKKFHQLFISTHNLDFLKYIKRISVKEENVEYFLIERLRRQNNFASFIKPMPNHLKEYVTEFNYLFAEMYKMYKDVSGERSELIKNTYNQFYNLPNNIRKFLEYYLFYRYPNQNKLMSNLEKLFDDNVPSLINRVINEYSHLNFVDRGWKPFDVDELEDCVKIIFDEIKKHDEGQFNALLESIGS